MKLLRPATRWLPAVALALAAAWAPSHAELGPRPTPLLHPAAGHARVIVEFKSGLSDFRRTVQSAGASGGGSARPMTAAEAVQAMQLRASQLGNRVGLALQAGHAVSERAQVVMADGIDSQTLVQRLANDPQVASVVVDGWRKPLRVPNDPYYPSGPAVVGASGGPAVGQWYLRAPLTNSLNGGDETNEIVSSINAPAAWDITTGHSSVVVAVLDTGIRPDHPDLAGKIVAGYDMISDAKVANDGDGRDADPSDPGDYVTDAEVNDKSSPFYQCTPKNPDGTYSGESSSWHGTQTAALIGAATNNNIGIAGAGWNVRVEPVRVLGKCGGYDSDIAAGIEWATGNTVPGVPANPNPVKVLNLSLGGSGYPAASCTGTAYPAAIADARAKGAVIVVSAGNGLDDGGHALNPPANCSGVIAVAGLRHTGTKVGFSDLGPDVSIAAPAGNCVNTSGACVYPIMSASNTGTQAPVSSKYTDSFDYGVGTSFSAPLVSATAALMFTANPSLTPDQVLSALKATARPFPQTGAQPDSNGPLPTCTAPGQTGQLQCYCTTSTCGAGMLDAGAAVAAVAQLTAYIDVSPSSGAVASSPITLSSASTVLPTGRTIASTTWSLLSDGGIVPALADTSSNTITLTPTAAGQFTVQLVVTDNTGATSTTQTTVQVADANSSGGSGGSGGSGSSGGSTSSGGSSGGGGAMSAAWLAGLAVATLSLGVVRARRRSLLAANRLRR
jgi:serine protease